jgi:hypothetical protein
MACCHNPALLFVFDNDCLRVIATRALKRSVILARFISRFYKGERHCPPTFRAWQTIRVLAWLIDKKRYSHDAYPLPFPGGSAIGLSGTNACRTGPGRRCDYPASVSPHMARKKLAGRNFYRFFIGAVQHASAVLCARTSARLEVCASGLFLE